MAIDIYSMNPETMAMEKATMSALVNPIKAFLAPGGGRSQTKLFLRNDDVARFYHDITLKPTTVIGADIVGAPFVIKLLSGQRRPSESDWGSANDNSASTITSPVAAGQPRNRQMPDLGALGAPDTNYYPFWVSVELIKGAPIGAALFSIEIDYTESNIV